MIKTLITLTVLTVVSTSTYAIEYVKNSKGEKIELKDNGTWKIIPKTADDFLGDNERYTVKIEDGNKVPVDVLVIPNITLMGIGRSLTKDEMYMEMRIASISAQYKLKNRFSYKPREIRIEQKGKDVKMYITYTGNNGYGAEVPSTQIITFYIEDNEKLKKTSPVL